VPADAMTVTNYYKQSVYDPSNNKVGDILDLMVDKNGRITIAMVGVGGFLGIDEKNVAIPFGALTVSQKGNQRHLTLNTTKDALKSAPGQLPEIAFTLSFYLVPRQKCSEVAYEVHRCRGTLLRCFGVTEDQAKLAQLIWRTTMHRAAMHILSSKSSKGALTIAIPILRLSSGIILAM
jgi:sporulation protein YlmC with PRC-barrel domain